MNRSDRALPIVYINSDFNTIYKKKSYLLFNLGKS